MIWYQTVWTLQPKGLFANVCSHYPPAMPFLYIRSPEGSLRRIHTAQFLIQIFFFASMIRTISTSPFFSSTEQNFSSNREKRAQRSQIQSAIITVESARAFVVSVFVKKVFHISAWAIF